jgi:putative hydrolase of the HAD superfamily
LLIIFDLDDTLIDTSGCITPVNLEHAIEKMVESGLSVGNYEAALETLKRLDTATESASETLLEFIEMIDADKKFFEIGEKEVYGPIPADIPIFPLDQAAEILTELSEFHQLALVSKGKPDQQLFKLKSAGIDSTIFSKMIVTEEGDKKPHYKTILEELGFAPSQTLVCGDRIKRDLTPAKELGCVTVHMQWGRGLSSSGGSKDVDFAIKKMGQIKEVITKVLHSTEDLL